MENKNKSSNIIIVITIVALIGFYFYNQFKKLGERKISDPIECNELESVSISTIYDENINNEVLARDKYLDKSFNFSGVVESINYNEFTKDVYLKVRDGSVIAEVYLNYTQDEISKSLNSGDTINFCGTIKDLNPILGSALDIDNAIIK